MAAALTTTLKTTADANFAGTFDIRISGYATRHIATPSLDEELGGNGPQIRRGLGLIRARFPPPKSPGFGAASHGVIEVRPPPFRPGARGAAIYITRSPARRRTARSVRR